MGLLGSMIHDAQVIGDVVQILQGPEDFYVPAHVVIYSTLLELYDQHESADIVQLNQRLADMGTLEDTGGTDYLIELVESVPSQAGAEYWAQIVRDKAILRRLIEVSGPRPRSRWRRPSRRSFISPSNVARKMPWS